MRKSLLIILFSLLTFIGCSNIDNNGNNNDNQTENAVPSLKDDYYEAVNYKTIENWEIPAGNSIMDYSSEAANEITEILNGYIKEAVDNSSAQRGSDEYNIAAYYETMTDYETRNSAGLGNLQQYIDQIDNAQTVQELLRSLFEIEGKYSFPLLFHITTIENPLDSATLTYQNNIVLDHNENSFILQNEKSIEAVKTYYKTLLVLYGKTEQDALNDTEQIVNMIQDIKNELSNSENNSNELTTFSTFAGYFNNNLTINDLKEFYGINEDTNIIISNKNALQKVIGYFTEENLEVLKSYIKSLLYAHTSKYVGVDVLNAYINFSKAVLGVDYTTFQQIEDTIVTRDLQFELGRIYFANNLNQKDKEYILSLTEELLSLYRQRINNLSWMSDATKAKAVEKIDKMEYVFGVSENEEWPQDLYKYQFSKKSEGGIFINNYLEKKEKENAYIKDIINNKIEFNAMISVPQDINAYYYPVRNKIYILPGYLYAPNYSVNASNEDNLGGIGAVIAHEITHAFDNTGALYDADGNMGSSWWQPEDYAKFQELTYKVVAYYDNYTINGVHVNGEQTLGENIADLGAISCITEYAKNKGYDLDKVYKSYAKNWAIKATPEYINLLLAVDPHSPNKVRVNAVLSAMDDFYILYDIKETDGMYKEPSIRPSIW